VARSVNRRRRSETTAFHVRRDKAALFQWVQAPPGDRSSRKRLLANTCVEATARCSAELGYQVTLVRGTRQQHLAPKPCIPRRCGWVLTPNGRGRGGDTGPTDGSPPRPSGTRDRRAPRPRVVKITAHRFGTAPCRLRDVPWSGASPAGRAAPCSPAPDSAPPARPAAGGQPPA
jgi:hypothetical protein